MQPRWVQMPISTSHCVLALLDARRVGLRIGQARDIDVARLLDLFLGAVVDEDRLAAPEHLDDLALGDRAEVDLDRRAGGDRRGVRVHLRDQRHQRPRRRRPRRPCRSRCRGNRGVSARPKCVVTSSSPLLLPVSPSARKTANATRNARGGGRAGRTRPWGRTKGGDPAAFIGTLAKRAQARTRAQ